MAGAARAAYCTGACCINWQRGRSGPLESGLELLRSSCSVQPTSCCQQESHAPRFAVPRALAHGWPAPAAGTPPAPLRAWDLAQLSPQHCLLFHPRPALPAAAARSLHLSLRPDPDVLSHELDRARRTFSLTLTRPHSPTRPSHHRMLRVWQPRETP